MARERDKPYARLAVVLASQVPVGVIFRRVRSKLFQLVMWNRETDQFDPGQWFKGKIYPDQSDISPDGRHLIYFAMGGLAWAIPATGGTWTAISRLPALTAIALWGQGGGTRGGGGMFTSNDSFWIDLDLNTVRIRDDSGLRREVYRPLRSPLERNGWTNQGSAEGPLFAKSIGQGWLLQKGRLSGYRLAGPDGRNLDCKTWEWADWDRERLVWAEKGCLRTVPLLDSGLGAMKTLYDFNDRAIIN